MRIQPSFFAVILTALIMLPHVAAADSASVAIFERSLAPSYVWGQNGLLLTPIADTLGPWNLGISTTHVNAGRIEGDQVLDSKGTFAIDTNGYFEVGYTRKALTFPYTFERTPVTSDIFHIKSKVVDLKRRYVPKLAIGTFAFNVQGTRDLNPNDVFFNGFAVLQEDIPMGEQHMLRLHGGAQAGLLGVAKTEPFLFGGTDLLLFNRLINLAVEVQGASRENQSGIVNGGIAFNFLQFAQVGVGAFNLYNFGAERDRVEFLFQASLNLPLDRIYHKVATDRPEAAPEVPEVEEEVPAESCACSSEEPVEESEEEEVETEEELKQEETTENEGAEAKDQSETETAAKAEPETPQIMETPHGVGPAARPGDLNTFKKVPRSTEDITEIEEIR